MNIWHRIETFFYSLVLCFVRWWNCSGVYCFDPLNHDEIADAIVDLGHRVTVTSRFLVLCLVVNFFTLVLLALNWS